MATLSLCLSLSLFVPSVTLSFFQLLLSVSLFFCLSVLCLFIYRSFGFRPPNPGREKTSYGLLVVFAF